MINRRTIVPALRHSPLTLAAALAILGGVPAVAGEAAGQWAIDRGANAANVHVSVTPLPDGTTTAAPECAPQPANNVVEYTFPSASGVTVYITPAYSSYPAYSPYLSPYSSAPSGYGYGAPYGTPPGYVYGFGGAASPRVVVWATDGGRAY